MSASLSRTIFRAPSAHPKPSPSRVAKRDNLWGMMLQASEAAVRHNYAAPWRTVDSL